MARAPRSRADSDTPAFVCPSCDVLLWDGVHYEKCPACNSRIDTVDPDIPIWCCRSCDRMVNRAVEAPQCERCAKAMVPVFAGSPPGETGVSLQRFLEGYIATPTGLTLLWVGSLLPLASLALHPVYRWFALGLAPLMVLPLLLGGSAVYYLLLGGIPELRAIARDRRLRVVHGFEHGAANVLEKEGVPVSYGMSYENGSFELAIRRDDEGKPFPAERLRAGTIEAIDRIARGETRLAYHPRCGSTAIALIFAGGVASLVIAAVALLMSLTPLAFAGLIALTVAGILFGHRALGSFIQHRFTVDTRFDRAKVVRVVQSGSSDRDVVYKVEIAVDLDARDTTQRVAAARPAIAPAPPAAPVVPRPPKEAPAPKPVDGVRCPACAWVPDQRDLWRCECGWRWNTFSTHGECPVCAHRFTETQCRSCRAMSPHEAWYVAAPGSGRPPAAA